AFLVHKYQLERWEPGAEKPTWTTTHRLAEPYYEAKLEVSADGRWLAAVGEVGVTAFDAGSGKELFRVPDGQASALRSDSRVLAVAVDNTIGLFDPATGDLLPQSSDPVGSITPLMFTHEGRRLAGHAIRWVSWDLNGPTPHRSTVLPARVALLSPDGRVG